MNSQPAGAINSVRFAHCVDSPPRSAEKEIMTRCPHCSAVSNPLRFITYTKWTLYKCGNCGRRSQFKQSHMMILAGIGGGLGGGSGLYFIQNFGWIGLLFLILLLSVLGNLVMWFFLPLEPTEAEQAAAPDG